MAKTGCFLKGYSGGKTNPAAIFKETGKIWGERVEIYPMR
jgi:hypothetical protein